MFRLLTEEERAKVSREYSKRVVVVSLTSFIVVLIIALAGLFPAFILSKARLSEVTERVKLIESGPATETTDLRKWLQEIKLELETLSPSNDIQHSSEYIFEALDLKPSSIRITGIEWLELDGKTTLSLSGVAGNRQAILDLESVINGSRNFSDVSLPLSNLVKSSDIPFNIKLSPIFKP